MTAPRRRHVRAVLTPELKREVLEQWAARLGWALRYESERSGSELRGRTWTVDEATELTFFEDHILGVYFIHATGDHAEEAAIALRDVVDLRERDELFEEAERASYPAAKIASLGPAVRAVDPAAADARLLALSRARLGDANPSVRRAALVTLGMLEWPEIDAMLDAFEADPVLGPGVRLRRWARARQRAEGAGDFDTHNVGVLLGRAVAAIAEGAWERALAAIDRLLARGAGSARAYALRAAVRRGQGRRYLAYADALTAVALGKGHVVDVADARALAEEIRGELLRERKAAPPEDNLVTNLAALLDLGRHADVEEVAVGLLAVPSRQEALVTFYRGLAAYEEGEASARAGRRAEALRHLARAVELDRRWAEKAKKDASWKPLAKSAAWKRLTGG